MTASSDDGRGSNRLRIRRRLHGLFQIAPRVATQVLVLALACLSSQGYGENAPDAQITNCLRRARRRCVVWTPGEDDMAVTQLLGKLANGKPPEVREEAQVRISEVLNAAREAGDTLSLHDLNKAIDCADKRVKRADARFPISLEDDGNIAPGLERAVKPVPTEFSEIRACLEQFLEGEQGGAETLAVLFGDMKVDEMARLLGCKTSAAIDLVESMFEKMRRAQIEGQFGDLLDGYSDDKSSS